MEEMVVMECQDLEVSLAEMVRLETLDRRDLLDPRQEESFMSGGVEPPAQIRIGVHWKSCWKSLLSPRWWC